MKRSTPDLRAAAWRKSSYSNTDGGACVEVADGFPGVVPVRDSKDVTRGALAIRPESWAALTTAIKG